MNALLNPLDRSLAVWLITFLCAFLVGVSKSGLKGSAMMAIPILAHLYGGKLSVGILLPSLIMGDLMAIFFYHKSTQIRYIIKLLPYAAIGILVAVYVGDIISDIQFKYTIGIAIFACLALLLYSEVRKAKYDIINHPVFSGALGLSGGFATMIGNAAGPIFNLYLLSMRLQKVSFIATGAWFYFILNVAKVPFHVFVWHTISLKTIHLNALMLPGIIMGSFLGKYLTKFIPEKEYRYFVLIVTFISAALLFFN